MLELYGKGVSDGIAIGKLAFYSNSSDNVPKYSVTDTTAELKRYKNPVKAAKRHLMSLYEEACKHLSKSESVIFQTHIMILEDSKFVETVESLILTKHLNAEFAVKDTAMKIAEIFRSMDDEYLQQRYTDIIDAANTVQEILRPKQKPLSGDAEPVIVAASELLPSETISLKQRNLLGFVTTKGSRNSHTAILARTLGLPLVTQIKGSLSRYDGMEAIIDGQSGRVVISPDHNTVAHYRAKQKHYEQQQQYLRDQIGLPSVTKDGQAITLSSSIDTLDGVEAAKNSDAVGVGLFKTDYLFAKRAKSPTEQEQVAVYETLLRTFENQRIVIQLANLGSEKSIPYLDIPEEKNPAIGYKGIRVLLDNKELFMTQLRALFRASVNGNLAILLPMVNNIEEIDYVKRTIEEVKLALRAKRQKYSPNIALGTMIETPAAALIADEICRISDFVMIGTNALTQYTLAMDRENQKLEYFYEPYHKGVLRLIRYVCRMAHTYHKPVAVGGELASDTHMTKSFLAFEADELVVVPSKLLDVKAAVRAVDAADKEAFLQRLG
ncbi:MAG: phosphoenolpyruvate--protein phosphotransferase [Acutalibacteraceae bacterium]|nr:phosphoenolpyruvate--protein phosphotransferase [Acutalibacteraceae bacterium]